jgi:hypothetical protein
VCGIVAAQRSDEEFQEGIDCPPLVLLTKGHQAGWVDNKASCGCRPVDQDGVDRAGRLAVCCNRRHALPGMRRTCHLDNPPCGPAAATSAMQTCQ